MRLLVLGLAKLFWIWIKFEIAILWHPRSSFVLPLSSNTSPRTAVVGHSAHLPCELGKPEKEISLILWYKELSPYAIYTLDARVAHLPNAIHKIHPDFQNRAHLNVTGSGESFLLINPVHETDGGEYKCVVEYRRSRTKEQELILKVIVPPKETIIMDEHGQHLQGLIGPYNEGQSLSLVCESDGGFPLPSLTWWRGSTLLDDSYVETPQGFSRNELLLPVLVRDDLLIVLSCQARNTYVEGPVSSSIQIDMNLKPLDVRITSPERPFSANRESTVECRAFGARPSAQITWWMSGKQLGTANEIFNEHENLTISILRFLPNSEDNEKELSCRAENPQIYKSDIENTRIIRVHFKPHVTIAMDGYIEGKPADEGKDLTLRCFVKANPPNVSVRWKFRDRYVNPQHDNVAINGDVLRLKSVRKQNRGHYRCTATNSEGESESQPILVEVQYVPECLHKRKSSYVVSKFETLKVTCDIDAYPPDITFHWTMVKSQEAVIVKPVSINGTSSVVSITPMDDEDYGSLQCVTRNSVGEQLKPCVFDILPAGPPEPVKNCTVFNKTSDYLSVHCEAGSDSGYQQHFFLEVFNTRLEKMQANMTSTKAPSFNVNGLSSGSSYILFLYALNANGKSKAVAIRVETLHLPDESKEFQAMSMLTPALMGLVSTVAVLVLCAVLIVATMKLRPRNPVPRDDYQADKKNRQPKYSWKDSIVPVSPGPGPDVVPEENFCKGGSNKCMPKSLSYVPDGPFGECLFQEIPLDALPTNHLVKGLLPIERRKDEDDDLVVSAETPLMDKLPGPFAIYKSSPKDSKESPEEWTTSFCSEDKERPQQY